MSKNEVVKNMMIELDFIAREYGKYEDEQLKSEVALEFRTTARAYNILMRSLFKTVKGSTFRRNIKNYIADREIDGWS